MSLWCMWAGEKITAVDKQRGFEGQTSMRIYKPSVRPFTRLLAFVTASWLAGLIGAPDSFSNTRGKTAADGPSERTNQGNTTKKVETHRVTLRWDASTSAVAGYNVYRSDKSGGPYKKLNPSPIKETTYTYPTVRAGRTYYYLVKSVTAKDVESIASNEISAVIPVP